MRWISDVTPVGRLPRLGGTIGIGSLCVGLLAGLAVAQSQPANAKGKAQLESKKAPAQTVDIQNKARAEALAKQRIKNSARKPSRKGASFTPEPNTKWACAKPTVEVEPIWRGDKSLTFAFDIKNEGTADLKYRPRGG